MKIKKLSIYNLKSLKKIESVDISSGLDIFIGQNDAGKSSILQALDAFFNKQQLSFEENKSDLCYLPAKENLMGVDSFINFDEVCICLEFQLNQDDLMQDRSKLVSYAHGNSLVVCYKACGESRWTGGRGAAKNFAYYAYAQKFKNDDYNSLLGKSESDLIELMEKYPGSKDFLVNLNKAGKPENIERVNALLTYAKFTDEEYVPSFEQLDFPATGKMDAIWPSYKLIDTTTKLDGKNKVIEDAFNKVDEKIKELHTKKLEEIKKDLAREYQSLTKGITAYAKSHYLPSLEQFTASPSSVNISVLRDLLIKRVGQPNFTHFDAQGDGTKRRLMVAILQSSADSVSRINEQIEESEGLGDTEKQEQEYVPARIWAFDEPEIHLHPAAQRDLFNAFQKFKNEDIQILCSTHSTIFIDSSELDSVHLIELDETMLSRCNSNEGQSVQAIKEVLGIKNSDIFLTNRFIIVEGPTESAALPLIYEYLIGSTLYSQGLSLHTSKGCNESIDKINFLYETMKEVVFIFDLDVKSSLGKELEKFEEAGLLYYIGAVADFEDSFSDEVWLKVLQNHYDIKSSDGDSIWTIEAIQKIKSEIDPKVSNKKMIAGIENYCFKAVKTPLKINKPDCGRHLARYAIESESIPVSINYALSLINPSAS